MLDKVELSFCSYDTAWVAMIPSPNSPQDPLFPQCLNWLLDNQLSDGSWGLVHGDSSLRKDSLLSTLACVLALKQWGVAEQHICRGLQYIESNFASVNDNKQHSPIGGWASTSQGWKAYLAYISEGLGKSQNWEMVMKYQRKNGSLFNSPATTAAAFTHLKNPRCLDYLLSLLDRFVNAVPTVYPLDVYARLCMVENVERMGIDRHFKEDNRRIMDDTYRLWMQGEEEIFSEPTTCAMAFRLLRLHGYNVSSDALSQYSEVKFSNSLQGYLKDLGAILELYKASEIVIYSDEDDSALEELNFWTRHKLQKELPSSPKRAYMPSSHVYLEVNHALRFPHYAKFDRLYNRRSIELYNVDHKKISKASYSSPNLASKAFLKLAAEDFNICQSLHRKELEEYNRWILEHRIDKLGSPRNKMIYSFLAAASSVFSPELTDARLSWTKSGCLTIIVDDFFDLWASEEDMTKIIQLLEKWNVDVSTECCSQRVEILFLAIKNVICDTADKAFKLQGRDVTKHLIEVWLDLMRCEVLAAEWRRARPKLPKETIESPEYNRLCELTSVIGRLLNDIAGFKRETEQGKLSAISLYMIQGSGAVSLDKIIEDMKGKIKQKTCELLRLVLQEKGSVVPRICKDVFWGMSKSLHVVYMDDGMNLPEIPDKTFNIIDTIIKEPIIFNEEK
ncbi:hypothetical protein L6164_022884 [Bauhinia variegata]|uniref:Uncharacterized protein n=1 Tax=Bauhinia variegata TaxID=167791 RepID=A0ACB9MH52_BAUVA|nr:hypothetical protein L6164_022884 [Bauhinia variegata]